MKKTNLFLSMALSFCLLKAERSHAQITAVRASISDSVYSSCLLPSNTDIFVYASVTGTGTTATDSIIFNINFGDGSDTTFKTAIYFSGGTFGYANASLRHTYTIPGTFTSRVIVEAVPSGLKDTTYGGPLTLTNTCGSLSGHLYLDTNSNCIKDSGEQGLYWTPIVAINTATADTFLAGWADYSGKYSLNLIPGSYTIIPNYYYNSPGLAIVNPYAIPSCPATGTYALTVTAGTPYTKDFAYTCGTPTSYDASVMVSGGCFVPGDTTSVYFWGGSWAWYYYFSCISAGISTTVTVNLDPSLIYIRSYYGPTPSISGSTLTYTLSAPDDINRFHSGIMVLTPTTATIGDTIKISAYIAPLSSIPDPNLTNNTYNYQKAVASSYDPNIKEVSPLGRGKQGFIAKNTEMTYTIHFQNTGTARAKNITIADEIDANLDINSIHILGATHKTNLYKDNKTIKFRFENINLPDSGADYAGSMGSVTYAIRQQKDLADGLEMKNTAAIYFDYNAPIITNTTLNTINIPTSIAHVAIGSDVATVYPNPANSTLNVKMANTKTFSVRMMDMLGRIVMTQSTANGELSINTLSIPSGSYIVHINDNNGNETSNKVQIKH